LAQINGDDPPPSLHGHYSRFSGIDDRSIIAVLVSAIKQMWAKVMALVQSDEAQNAEIEKLKARVSQPEAAAGAQSVGSVRAPAGLSAREDVADDASTTTPASDSSSTPEISSPSNDNLPAEVMVEPAPAQSVEAAEPVTTHQPELHAANDNTPRPSGEAI
jgi:hypothetical protein